MTRTRIAMGICVMMLSLAAVAQAEDKKSKVDELALDGYWLKDRNPDKVKEIAARLGKAVPALDLKEWIGKEVTAEQMKGQIVLVDFWATWCGPCIAAIPHNNEMAKKYADKGVILFGACGGRGEEKMADIAKDKKIEYPTAKVSAESTKAWDVHFWPTYAVIDRKGNLRGFGLRPDAVEKVLEALLEEQPAEKK